MAKELKINLAKSFMIVDRWRDVDCVSTRDAEPFSSIWGYGEKLKRDPDFNPHDLLDAAKLIEHWS